MARDDADAASRPANRCCFEISESQSGTRLDAFLAQQLAPLTRSRIQAGIKQGAVLVNRVTVKPSHRLRAGEVVAVQPWPPAPGGPLPESIPLDVIYEDEHLAVINKATGMVVHPAKGNWRGTLASAVAHRYGALSGLGGANRPGIVHRLDRDTSGVIVVARTDAAHADLTAQFANRTVRKVYLAVLRGELDRDADLIEQPIGIHPYHRERMAIRIGHPTSRPAVTAYRVLERFTGYCLAEIRPQTGRTHQIRVHMAYLGAPVAADRLYAGHARISERDLGGDSDRNLIDRQALHASQLIFRHPLTGIELTFEAPLPCDMSHLLHTLRSRPKTR